MSGNTFADAHIHVTQDGLRRDYPDLDDAEMLLGCTAKTSEWGVMAACGMRGLVRFYGVHPWYADGWGGDACDRLRSILETDPLSNVGEIGLDSKHGSVADQIGAFTDQLDLCSGLGRTANVHMVGCEREVLECIRKHGGGCRTVILHSFSSESYVKPFTDIGCMFSVNPRILARSETRVSRLLGSIPDDRLLLETDAPYTARGFRGMRAFAETVSAAAGIPADDLLSMTLDNARRAVHG